VTPQQLGFDGFDVPQPVRRHRLFFAAMPDPATAARAAQVAESLRGAMHVNARPLRTERLHVSLCALGDFVQLPDAVVARARAAAAAIDAPPFGVTFDRVGSFNGRDGHWPWVLTGSDGTNELIGFEQRLARVLKAAGLVRRTRARFTPHLTLLYGETRIDPRAIEPVAWTVREFLLIHSWLGETRYDVAGRWSLPGGGRTD